MATYDKEFIIRYAEDELSEDERRQFETDLLTDPSLAAELALYQEVKATLQQRLQPDAIGEALRNTLSDLNKTYFAETAANTQPATSPTEARLTPPARTDLTQPARTGLTPPPRRIPMIRWIAATAAAACVIVVIGLLVLPSHNDTFDRLGRTEMVGTTERGNNTDTLLQQAAIFFNHQQFDKALPLLDKAVQADTSSQLALFYRGIAAWHAGSVDSARKDLTRVYNGESLLRYEAAFYMALTYASRKDKASAEEWLRRIPGGTPVSARATELENKLK